MEGLATTFFQLKGYITSSNKWFWVWEEGKQQRGYQDIDVLAVDSTETLIVSVTGNLDDKVRQDRAGQIQQAMVARLYAYFDRCVLYLRSVPEYTCLVGPERHIRRIVVYATGQTLAKTLTSHLSLNGIELLDATDLMRWVQETIRQQTHIRTNNQLIKLIQLLGLQKGVQRDRT